jgi:hypothetical protein
MTHTAVSVSLAATARAQAARRQTRIVQRREEFLAAHGDLLAYDADVAAGRRPFDRMHRYALSLLLSCKQGLYDSAVEF